MPIWNEIRLIRNDTDVLWPEREKMGFGWIHRAMYLNIPNGETAWDPRGMSGRSYGDYASGLMVPHWFGVLIFAGLAWLPWLRCRFSLRTLRIATTLVGVVLRLIAAMLRWPAG
jgi:hypothetical protein